MGKRIKQAREALHMSQGELAELLGKTQNTISNYESGTRAVHAGELPRLASALQVTIPYLYGDDNINQGVIELLGKLTTPFRRGFLILLEQQLELQDKAIEALRKAGVEITVEDLDKAENLVLFNESEMRRTIRASFAEAVSAMLGVDDSDDEDVD